MALANQPRLLLMDEPTAGMAPKERIALMELTAQLARSKRIAVLFHRARHGRGCSARPTASSCFDRGRLIAEGTPQEVRANDAVARGLSRREPLMLAVAGLHAYYGRAHILAERLARGARRRKWWRCSAATAPANPRR